MNDVVLRLAARLDTIAHGVTMPGVLVKRHPDAVEVYFREGRFVRDARQTHDGADLLAAVGRRLAELDVPHHRNRASRESGTACREGSRNRTASLLLAPSHWS